VDKYCDRINNDAIDFKKIKNNEYKPIKYNNLRGP
jgi:hypothetical protein